MDQRQGERRERDEPVLVDRRTDKRRVQDKVACPYCGAAQSRVIPHHMTPDEEGTGYYWRRRRCQNPECAHQFRTYEVVPPLDACK